MLILKLDTKSMLSKKPSQKVKSTEVEVHTGSSGKAQEKVHTFLEFSFQMDSIICNLYSEGNEGLASFGVHFLSLKGTKLADESLSASVVLLDVQLDDIRPGRENYITR